MFSAPPPLSAPRSSGCTSSIWPASTEEARQRIAEVQQKVGSQASVRIAIGTVKEALIEAARQCDADVLMIGRSPQSGAHGRVRDLTYSMVRDSPYPVLSI
jgi:nucleotide-binding universal stress UspA family protein